MPTRYCSDVCSTFLAQNAGRDSHKNSRCRSRAEGLLGRADKWVASMDQNDDTSHSNEAFQNNADRRRDEIGAKAH